MKSSEFRTHQQQLNRELLDIIKQFARAQDSERIRLYVQESLPRLYELLGKLEKALPW